ncbi:MAG: NfeD family protein [Acholeplasmataceae bacterium]|nr:NfeD family protein [Acholeplasmataceae bacterium]
MLDWMQWLWLGLFLTALFIEFGTANMVSIWFAIAAIPSFIISLFSQNFAVQVVIFVVVAIIMLLLTRPFVMKYFKTNEIKTNVDSYIGLTGVCVKLIEEGSIGAAKVNNREWSAISNERIEIGEKVRVLDIEGVKLIVEKI